ncbi:MAG: hypothetical protein OZ913_09900 [Ignavibacteriaceae bacterium]|jgi:hypothetical protein|nr:MAG: hypothetical protein UZ04_CHB001000900 [Chlorobi bacterium OLB4]MBW7855704.1 hypothetical protein [Ignavibacteria bacterium]MEB2330593.1 hypothetical protein [Ignavibacteriaceae bacterium]OQY78627.1 MAG: hypothetical protein B6D43_02175 [Ignavibacteriales bacterium UTCHB1]
MRSIIILVAIFIVVGCNNKDKISIKEGEKQSGEIVRETNEKAGEVNEVISEEEKPNGIRDLQFDVQIPKNIKYKGIHQISASWKDNNGNNLIFITLTDEFPTPNSNGEDFRDKELYAYHYLMNDGESKLLWRVTDFIRECPVDIRLDYFPRSLSVTDLDDNGIAETAFMYALSCKGDVSPDDVKLIMHEGKTKYAIRGSNVVSQPEAVSEYEGLMNVDPSFNSAPDEFLVHAKKLWNRFRDL